MTDRSPTDPNSEGEYSSSRPSFRRRLLTTVGPALVVALAAIALVAWGATYVVYHRNAIETLETEVNEMRADARVNGDSLVLDDYAWDEAHHRLAIDRVDPIFVQVFDREGELLRSSTNIDSLRGVYPSRLLDENSRSTLLPALRTFRVDSQTLYYLTRPLDGADGEVRAHVQVARVLPEHKSLLWNFGLALAGLWLVLSLGLVALIAWAADRVLGPLREITGVAQSVTSADLETRVDVPDAADRETAVLAETLNALLDRIKEHVDTLRAFTANSAHELQTPLTVLRGHVEIALRRERSAESYRETLRLLDARLGEMVRTVRALLTLARLDRNGTLDREPVDLTQIGREEAESLREAARTDNLELSVENDKPVWTRGQADLLRKAVHNLVDNAIKYTPKGQVRIAVDRVDENRVQLTCTDTGIGMSEDEQSQITARFYRGEGADRTETPGSGLGLALVHRIVEKHGGQLRISSSPGEGTTISMILPAASEAPDRPTSHDQSGGHDPSEVTR